MADKRPDGDAFQKAKSTINEHIKNIFEDGEWEEEHATRKFGNSEFSTKPTNFYNLDVIISVGYRVKSIICTHFRIWATQRLRDYIIKGFVLDDERLRKNPDWSFLVSSQGLYGRPSVQGIFCYL